MYKLYFVEISATNFCPFSKYSSINLELLIAVCVGNGEHIKQILIMQGCWDLCSQHFLKISEHSSSLFGTIPQMKFILGGLFLRGILKIKNCSNEGYMTFLISFIVPSFSFRIFGFCHFFLGNAVWYVVIKQQSNENYSLVLASQK